MFPPVKRALAGLVPIAMAVGLAASCGGSSGVAPAGSADLANGQKLFQSSCGGCHTLAAAGTKGTIGPNLDAAYAQPAAEGWDRTSFEAMVREQISLGAPYAKPTPMPANLVTGKNAEDVAAFVAAAAANPKAAPPGS
jgi:mono/diheme cytochrome c family protein